MKIKEVDFRRSELYSAVLQNYYSLQALTLDSLDFVDRKYAKKINSIIFKEFKSTFKQAKRNYRSVIRAEKKAKRKFWFWLFKRKNSVKSLKN
ncbi:MAG: hypothetical protein ACI4M6_01325 [Christensenellaceae bacterium]